MASNLWMKSCQFNKSHGNKIYILYHEWCIHWETGLSTHTSFVHVPATSWTYVTVLNFYIYSLLPLALIRSSHRCRMQSFHSLPSSLSNENKEVWSPWVTNATLASIFLVTYSQAVTNAQLNLNKRLQMLQCFAYFPTRFYHNKTVLRFYQWTFEHLLGANEKQSKTR